MDCKGISIAPTIPRNKIGVAFDLILAIAKPAMVETRRMMEIAPAQTTVEFSNCWATGRVLNNLPQEAVEWPGAPKYCALDLKEVLIMNTNG